MPAALGCPEPRGREAKANRCWRVDGFNKQLFVRAGFNSGSQRELRRDAEPSRSWKIPPRSPKRGFFALGVLRGSFRCGLRSGKRAQIEPRAL